MTSQATPTLEEDDTEGCIVYRRQSEDTGLVEDLSNIQRRTSATASTDKYKLRAIRDFDPQKMDNRGRNEMEIFMVRNKVAKNLPHLQNKYRQQSLPPEVALTFTRGDILETIPPENIGDKSGWWIALHVTSGKVGPIQKKHFVILDNDDKLSTTELHGIPMEVLDKVLESSFLHWLLNSTSISRKVFTVLASVDFCWFQILTRQRFKNRILVQMKDIFGRTKRRSAIIRNNQNYLKEYIEPNKIMAKLLSLNCITENQMHFIQRRRNQSSEILSLMNSRDETKYYNFVKCFRQTNQKTVARILENGGAVIKLEVSNRGAECPTVLDTDTLHRNIEQLRNGARSWSLQAHELCSQLKKEGLEILNSQRNLENVVIWIWCRSQAALENLQSLYKSNQLAHAFFSFTNVQPTPSEVSKSEVIKIDSHEFRKKIVVCPIYADFTERIVVRRGEDVFGVTKLRGQIYVFCPFIPAKTVIRVFEDRAPFSLQKEIKMREIEYPGSLGSNEKESCLYVSEPMAMCVWKITREEPDPDDEYKIIKWLKTDYQPRTLSVSFDGHLLIASESEDRESPSVLRTNINLYGSEANLIQSVKLSRDIANARQAVETSIGTLVLLHWWVDQEGQSWSSGSHGEPKWVVSELSRDGQKVIHRFIPTNQEQELTNPFYLSLDSLDRVFVADSGRDRVVLLDFHLKWNKRICHTKDEKEIEYQGEQSMSIVLVKPWTMYYDEENGQLIVGGHFENQFAVNVYSVSRK